MLGISKRKKFVPPQPPAGAVPEHINIPAHYQAVMAQQNVYLQYLGAANGNANWNQNDGPPAQVGGIEGNPADPF
jgi:hypothetical protein